MASAYNYDDSDDEDNTGTSSSVGQESSVFLGFIDGPITEVDTPTIEDSFVGGEPLWFNDDSPPPADMLLCKNCSGPLSLLSQSFAPLEDKLYDRILYVFTCQKPSCRRKKGSVRAIRAVQKDPKKMEQLKAEASDILAKDLDAKLKLDAQKKLDFEATKDLFGSSSADESQKNPFGANPFASNPFASKKVPEAQSEQKGKPQEPTFASVAKKAAPIKPVASGKREKVKLQKFPGYFIYVDPEVFKKKKKDDFKMTSKIQELDQSVLDTEFEESDSSKAQASENPDIQRVATSLDDPVFGNFSTVTSYNSQQVLRYDLGGSPLLYTSKDDIHPLFANKDHELKIPNPGYNPSSTRQFELQLMPKLILDLEEDNIDILTGMEWGTIIVCTDKEDFVPHLDENHVGYVEEWCGVQWEEEIIR